jgi:hypothetical protein
MLAHSCHPSKAATQPRCPGGSRGRGRARDTNARPSGPPADRGGDREDGESGQVSGGRMLDAIRGSRVCYGPLDKHVFWKG